MSHENTDLAKARFMHFVRIDNASGCWMWSGYTLPRRGYGQFFFNGKTQRAHRVAWLLFRGAIPPQRYVCHSCDCPQCVNPDHLWIGDAAANNADMAAKGRARLIHYGPANGMAKLDPSRVSEIRELAAHGKSRRAIARLFGIAKSHVDRIVHYRVWSVEEVDELHRRIAILEQAIHDIVDGMDSSTLGVQYTSLDNPLQRARAESGAGPGKDGVR